MTTYMVFASWNFQLAMKMKINTTVVVTNSPSPLPRTCDRHGQRLRLGLGFCRWGVLPLAFLCRGLSLLDEEMD